MLEAILECQTRLIAALDARDTDGIRSASADLSAATEDLRRHSGNLDRKSLDLGLKQAEAARIRVKYLAAWNRQKIDRLAELRGLSSANIYVKPPERA